jgi:hypothetical protein
MNFEKLFKVAVLVFFALAIFIYGMVNRYQFIHVSGSLTGFACNHYTGKCEWLSPEEMGKEKIVMYSAKQKVEMGRQMAPQAPTPNPPQK